MNGAIGTMPYSFTSVLHQPSDFRDALAAWGYGTSVLTEQGPFQARLTDVALQHLRLIAVQENLSRIGFIRVPEDMVLFAVSVNERAAPIWAGFSMHANELITICGGEAVHIRTDGASYWCAILFPMTQFKRFGRALTGKTPELPEAVCVWQPPPLAGRRLLELIGAATRAVQTQWVVFTKDQATHGLEQQLIHLLIDCIAGAPVRVESPAAQRDRDLATRFEVLLQSRWMDNCSISDLCPTLETSAWALRRSCKRHLNMSPTNYRRLRRMQQANRAQGKHGAGSATA